MFSYDSEQTTVRRFVTFYMVSGQALETVEPVQVVVRLPYCLYIPSTRYLFDSPDSGETVGVVPEKVWTKRAEGSTVLNSEPVARNAPIYLRDNQLITDSMGQPRPLTGDIQAINMEFDRDPNGYFRYSRLTVEFDWPVPSGYDPSRQRDDHSQDDSDLVIVEQISTLALPHANHFIDVYRTTTEDVYIERVPVLVVEDIRIGIHKDSSIRLNEQGPGGSFVYKFGYLPNMLGMHGIRPAMVSKPLEVVESFRTTLASGTRPPTDELLRQSALAALERHDAKLAVIESCISLEVFVERFYFDKSSGTETTSQIEDLLGAGNNWRLEVRLRELLREHFGKSISDIDNGLWSKWLEGQQHRHGIVHRNLVPSEEEASEVLQLNESIKRAMETL